MSNPTELPDERAEFESAQHKYHWPLAEADLRQDKIGNYYNHVTQANWGMWQARAALARRAQPEGEAPQAEPVAWMVPIGGVYEYFSTERAARQEREALERCMSDDTDEIEHVEPTPLYEHPPAATLSPLCGAQQAEIGEESIRQHEAIEAAVDRCYPPQDSPHASVNDKIGAARLAFRKGYRAALAAQQAAAPGTPEAPKGSIEDYNEFNRLLDLYDDSQADNYAPLVAYIDGFIAHAVSQRVRAALNEAAQLDGGQEGSDHA